MQAYYQDRQTGYSELGENAYFEILVDFLNSLGFQVLGESNLDKLLRTGLGEGWGSEYLLRTTEKTGKAVGIIRKYFYLHIYVCILPYLNGWW